MSDSTDNQHRDLQSRLEELRAEKEKGDQLLQNMEMEASELRSQLLRISGAIQVLEELTGTTSEEPQSTPGGGPSSL